MVVTLWCVYSRPKWSSQVSRILIQLYERGIPHEFKIAFSPWFQLFLPFTICQGETSWLANESSSTNTFAEGFSFKRGFLEGFLVLQRGRLEIASWKDRNGLKSIRLRWSITHQLTPRKTNMAMENCHVLIEYTSWSGCFVVKHTPVQPTDGNAPRWQWSCDPSYKGGETNRVGDAKQQKKIPWFHSLKEVGGKMMKNG